MPQVSRRQVQSSVWELAWNSVISSFKDLKDPDEIHVFITSVLTETEQIMVTKRLMIGLLLQSGWGPRDIADVLKVSTATVYKTKDMYEGNPQFQDLIQRLFPEKVVILPTEEKEGALEKFLGNLMAGKRERWRMGKLGEPD